MEWQQGCLFHLKTSLWNNENRPKSDMLWFLFFSLNFWNKFKFFKLGWSFSNQIEIFKPVYLSTIYKNGKIPLSYFPLSYSLLFLPSSSWFIISIPQLLYPFPQIPIKPEY